MLDNLETGISQLNEQIHHLNNNKEKMEGECNVLQERIKNLDSNFIRLGKRDIELKEELDESGMLIKQNSIKVAGLDSDYAETYKRINSITDDFELNFKAINSIETELNEKQQKLITLINNHSELKSKLNSANAFIDNINKRKGQVEGDVNLLQIQSEDKKKQYDKSVEDLEDFIKKIEDCKEQIEEIKEKRQKYEDKAHILGDKSEAEKSEKEALFSRLKVLEEIERDHGGYSRAVRVIMAEHLNITKGFCGVVGEMIKVPPQYVTAIEIALTGAVQSIITNTENDAKLLIEYLKENKSGRATFLPISSVKPRYFNDREKKLFAMEGFIGIASDLIEYDSKIDSVIRNLLGRTAVVSDIDAAIKLAREAGYEYKIVTLAGEVINAGGSITGGSLQSSSSSVLSRKIEIESLRVQYEKKQKGLEELIKELEKMKELSEEADSNIEFKTEILHSLQIDMNNYSNRCENLKNDIQVIKDRISINMKDLTDLEREHEETSKMMEESREKTEAAEGEKAEIESRISALQEQMKQFKDIKDNYNEEITELKIKLASVEQNKRTLESLIESSRVRIEEIIEEIEANKEEIEEHETETQLLKADLEEKEKAIKADIFEADEKLRLYSEGEKERALRNEELRKAEEDIKNYGKDIAVLQSDLHKIELQNTRLEIELEGVEIKLLETYEMNYDKAQKFKDQSLTLTWANKRCEELKEDIRSMGTVNVNAIEEYAEVSKRHLFLSTQSEDLIKARDNLICIIAEISENMKNQFITEFAKINENFNEVFKKLFGGGYAKLVILDEDNVLESGIEIIAKPPGKKLQNLMLLSGGERALTATALLFGILKMKPAPFCVLDEIDAGLDDANVDRFAEFLVSYSANTQFIVVTHRKGTMESADCLYGVSMEDNGVSKLVSVKLEDKVS